MAFETMKNAALTSPPPPPLEYVRAVVDAGAIETSYLLAGPRASGAPVVMLSPASDADVTRGSLLPALAGRFRVIAARPPVLGGLAAAPFSAWLREFLDGLGVAGARVVAEGTFGLPALGFALSDPARVGRLVLLFRDAADPMLPDAVLVDRLGRSGHPILVLRASADGSPSRPDFGIADVIRFLDGEMDPAER